MKSFFSILLSLLILVSNFGFTYATHYCSGHAIESQITIDKKDLSCGMTNMKKTCNSNSSKEPKNKKKCCKNDYLSISLEGDHNSSIQQQTFEIKLFLTLAYTFFLLPQIEETQSITFLRYPPPCPEQDIHALYQTFLL